MGQDVQRYYVTLSVLQLPIVAYPFASCFFRKTGTFVRFYPKKFTPGGEFRTSVVGAALRGQGGDAAIKEVNATGEMDKKELMKKYESGRNSAGIINIRLSPAERVVLEDMMKKEDWLNVSGFIKHKVFGGNPDNAYRRIIKRSAPEDVQLLMRELLGELATQIGYLNYRFGYEADQLGKIKDKEKKAAKRASLVKLWKEAVVSRTDAIYEDCEQILRHLSVNVDGLRQNDIRNIPDDILEKMVDWDDTSSPVAIELGRRINERHDRKMKEYLANRKANDNKEDR